MTCVLDACTVSAPGVCKSKFPLVILLFTPHRGTQIISGIWPIRPSGHWGAGTRDMCPNWPFTWPWCSTTMTGHLNGHFWSHLGLNSISRSRMPFGVPWANVIARVLTSGCNMPCHFLGCKDGVVHGIHPVRQTAPQDILLVASYVRQACLSNIVLASHPCTHVLHGQLS